MPLSLNSPFVNIPIEYARGASNGIGYKAAKLDLTLTANTIQTFQEDLTDIGLDVIATVWVDNFGDFNVAPPGNTGHLRVRFNGVGFVLNVAPGMQGFFPVLCTPGRLNIDVVSDKTQNNRIIFLNKEGLPLSWAG